MSIVDNRIELALDCSKERLRERFPVRFDNAFHFSLPRCNIIICYIRNRRIPKSRKDVLFKDVVFRSQGGFFNILPLMRHKVFLKNVLKCSLIRCFFLLILCGEIFKKILLIVLCFSLAVKTTLVFGLRGSSVRIDIIEFCKPLNTLFYLILILRHIARLLYSSSVWIFSSGGKNRFVRYKESTLP